MSAREAIREALKRHIFEGDEEFETHVDRVIRDLRDRGYAVLKEKCPKCGDTLLGWRIGFIRRRCRLCGYEWEVEA